MSGKTFLSLTSVVLFLVATVAQTLARHYVVATMAGLAAVATIASVLLDWRKRNAGDA